MVDARLPGNWLNEVRFMDLSDKAWRIFTGALMWSNEQGTDGRIPARYVRFLHPDCVDDADLEPLIGAGLFVRTEDGIEMPGWGSNDGLRQSTADAVKQYRDRKRANQAEYRNRLKSGSEVGHVTGNVTGNVGIGSSSSSEVQASAYVTGNVTGHTNEPNARNALTRIHHERRLPLGVDELLQHAYRLGVGDPWEGYKRIKDATEAAIVGATSPAAVLRKRLEAA